LTKNGVRISLLGVGKVGRELIERTSDNPGFRYVALGDRSGIIVDDKGFSTKKLRDVIKLKENGKQVKDRKNQYCFYEGMHEALSYSDVDVLVDVSDAQTYDILVKALDLTHVVTSNKSPIADCSNAQFKELKLKARKNQKILDIGATVGAGMRIPDLISGLAVDGIENVSGCLSGTMNYISQRINEGASISVAVREAMEPPRCYTEPDPRVDLSGGDFAKKLVIIGRICNKEVDRDMVNIEDMVPNELRALSIREFLEALPVLDTVFKERISDAGKKGKAMWFLGTADIVENEYRVGFEEVSADDQIAKSRESDNALKIFPKNWRRPMMITGPGAGVPETVTGLMAGLQKVYDAHDQM